MHDASPCLQYSLLHIPIYTLYTVAFAHLAASQLQSSVAYLSVPMESGDTHFAEPNDMVVQVKKLAHRVSGSPYIDQHDPKVCFIPSDIEHFMITQSTFDSSSGPFANKALWQTRQFWSLGHKLSTSTHPLSDICESGFVPSPRFAGYSMSCHLFPWH